jgi:hypothetical protein
LPLRAEHPLLRVERWIDPAFSDRRAGIGTVSRALVDVTALQSKIVRYGEDPSAKVLARFAEIQVLEERQENLLRDFFPVFN